MSQTSQPMKWHNFLVKIGLPLGAIANIAFAVLFITGYYYDSQGGSSATVYRYYKSLQGLDIIYGLCLALCGVFTWQTRCALKDYRKSAPSMVMVLYGMNLATTLMYAVGILLVINARDFSSLSEYVTTITSCILGIALHKVYYQKRAHMFVR